MLLVDLRPERPELLHADDCTTVVSEEGFALWREDRGRPLTEPSRCQLKLLRSSACAGRTARRGGETSAWKERRSTFRGHMAVRPGLASIRLATPFVLYLRTFHDAEVALRAGAECLKRLLVSLAFVS